MRIRITFLMSLLFTMGNAVTLSVKTQSDWDNISNRILSAYNSGDRNITINVKAKKLEFGRDYCILKGINDEKFTVTIKGNGAVMIPYGSNCKDGQILQHYSINDVFLDKNNRIIDNKDQTMISRGVIEPVAEFGKFYIYKSDNSIVGSNIRYDDRTMNVRYNVYRLKVDLPDLSESECVYFYLLLSRQWANYRHRVIKVENGYLYFKFVSDEAPSNVQKYGLDPNSDISGYDIQPRYRFINCPLNNRLYVGKDRQLHSAETHIYHGIGKCMIRIENCRMGSLVISGFNVCGCSDGNVLNVVNSNFFSDCRIYDNTFDGIANNAINIANTKNVLVHHNTIKNSRRGAITVTGGSSSVVVEQNILKNIGWMGQTFAINVYGNKIMVKDNDIEDFCYSAIASGYNSDVAIISNYIHYSNKYSDNYQLNTICDGGAVYIGPGTKRCVISDNIIYNFCGNGANRGIFCDDGCCNMDIKSNFILLRHNGTKGGYDIDLRYCETYKTKVPNHNTNNHISGNFLTGYYRFQGKGPNDGCFDGSDYVFDTGLLENNKLNVSNNIPDVVYKGCEIKDGYVVVPKKYSKELHRNHLSKKAQKIIKYASSREKSLTIARFPYKLDVLATYMSLVFLKLMLLFTT